ncbi:MAG TPA: hypothetical protein DCS93_32220 [Microscillaceae bacterium]|nr:hypothetical protein [Microscillaceae bacterium]
MHKIWIHLLILFTGIPAIFAQSASKIDSLEVVLQSDIGTKQKVDAYNTLAQYFSYKKTKQSNVYIDQAIQLAQSIDYLPGLIQAYSQQAKNLAAKRSFEKAEKRAQQALLLAQKQQNKREEARAYLALVFIAHKQREYQSALNFYSQAEKLGQTSNTPLILIEAQRMKAAIYASMKNDSKRMAYYAKALETAKSNQVLEEVMRIQKDYASFYQKKRDRRALQYAMRALEISESLKDYNEKATLNSLLASYHKSNGNYVKALDYFLKELKVRETFLVDSFYLAINYNKIGVLLYEQQNYEKAVTYYKKHLKVSQKLKAERLQALSHNNIALAYQHLRRYAEAKENYQKSILLAQKAKNRVILGWAYNGMGIINQDQKHYQKAKEWFDKAIAIRTKPRLLAQSYYSLGKNHQLQEQHLKAKQYYLKAADLVQQTADLALKRDIQGGLSVCYESLGETTKALASHQLFKQLADSLLNRENAKGITQLEATYRFQKEKDSLQFVEARKQEVLKNEIATRKANQRTTYIGLGLTLGLVVVLLYFFWDKQKSNHKLNQANEELAISNEEIKASSEEVQSINGTLQETLELVNEQKNNIVASINYAERIQLAVLPTAESIQDIFPEHFIFYKPRDIVSGDFYWVTKTESQPIYEESSDFQLGKVLLGFSNEKQILVVADCTGHGVPGAFMTMLCSQALNSIVIQNNVHEPGKILTGLDTYLRQVLKSKQTNVNDGMDIAICVIDSTEQTLVFAGAKSGLLYYQNQELKELKGDLHSINGRRSRGYQYASKTIQLTTPTTFYMHSDGYPDQFGGPQGRKFLKKRFREMIQDIATLPMAQQHQQLDLRLNDWMQDEEQLDDILVMGVKLT